MPTKMHLKKNMTRSFETSGSNYPVTQRQNPRKTVIDCVAVRTSDVKIYNYLSQAYEREIFEILLDISHKKYVGRELAFGLRRFPLGFLSS